jgi:hypothetical protein
MKLGLSVPDLSTLSRWRRLTDALPVKSLSISFHLDIDSTGVKVYGEGELKGDRKKPGEIVERLPCRK